MDNFKEKIVTYKSTVGENYLDTILDALVEDKKPDNWMAATFNQLLLLILEK